MTAKCTQTLDLNKCMIRTVRMAEEPFNTDTPSIGDRVKFWEEQDKINQELIPRVIRQHELLAEHIGEHANLPEIAGSAISQALAGAREEQRQQYDDALAAHTTQLSERTQAALRKALDDVQTALADAVTTLDERTQASMAEALDQLQAALATHRAALDEQMQTVLNQGLATLRQESCKTRNLLIGITAGLGAVSVAIMIAGIFIL